VERANGGLDSDDAIFFTPMALCPPSESQFWLDAAVQEAIEGDEKARRAFYDPDTSLSPPPLILGPQEYRDCSIWSADWRKGLPKDDPEHPSNTGKVVTWSDEQSLATLAAMTDLGLPRTPER